MTRQAPVQIAAAAEGQTAQRTFSIVAYTGEAMSIWPFDEPVVVDLASIDLSVQRLPALYDHMPYVDTVVGQIESLALVNGQLIASGKFTIDQKIPQERNLPAQVLAKADGGYQWQASIGGNPATMDQIKAGESVNVNGRDYPGPVRVARGVSLREISFVVLGGDRRTSAVVARNGMEASAMDFNEWLLTLGFEDPASLTDVQRANLQQQYNDEMGEEGTGDGSTPTNAGTVVPPVPDTTPSAAAARRPAIQSRAQILAQRRREEGAEVERVNETRRLCAAANNPTMTTGSGAAERQIDIAAHAIAEGWPVVEVRREIELQQLRSTRRGDAPGVIVRGHERDCTLQALQAAMILRCRGRIDSPAYQGIQALSLNIPEWLRAGVNAEQRQRAMESAHRYSDLSAVDLCREACRLDGRDAPHQRTELIRAAFSGSSLTNIFTTNVNAILLLTYMEAADTTAGWTREQDVADFKLQERPRMAKGPNLKKLPRGQSADHYDRSDLVETYKIARFAKQFVVDEQDIIDDSLGAMGDTPVEIGRAAARLRPDLVYAIILRNAALGQDSIALFHASHNNLNAPGALTSAAIQAAIAKLEKQQESGVNLNFRATHLIVPSDLKHSGAEFIRSATIVAAGTAGAVTIRGSENTIASIEDLMLVADARLSNGVIDPSDDTTQAGSTSTWYLASNIANTIEVGFLRGTGRAPQVRSFTLEKGQWGIGWDCKMDIGAKAIDFRGLQKNT